MKSQSIYKHFFAITGVLVGLSSFFLYKVITIGSAVAIVEVLDESALGKVLSVVAYFVLLGLLFPVLKYTLDQSTKLYRRSDQYRDSYIATYSASYPKPELSEYKLTREDYFSYNRRFQLDRKVIPILINLPILWVCIYFTAERSIRIAVLMGLLSLLVIVAVRFGLSRIKRKLSRSNPKHFALEDYIQRLSIYNCIQEELKTNYLNARL